MEKTKINIGGKDIPVKSQEFVDCNILKVTSGTTGWQEKGSKWDCQTYLSLDNEACTVMRAHVENDEDGYAKSVKLYFEGETELLTLLRSLKFAFDTLVEQSGIPGVHEIF